MANLNILKEWGNYHEDAYDFVEMHFADQKSYEDPLDEETLMLGLINPIDGLKLYLEAANDVRKDSLRERLKRERIVPRETTEKGDDNMEQRKFKVGDKVKYDNGTGNVYYGEVLADVHEGYVPVGLHGFEGHMLQAVFPELRKTIIEKGYENQCWFSSPYHLKLVEEAEMTPFEVLLKYWGIEVGEKFNIKEGQYNPYHFDKRMLLIDCEGDISSFNEWELVKGQLTIQKIEAKEMTVAEIEKELGYAIKVVKEEK